MNRGKDIRLRVVELPEDKNPFFAELSPMVEQFGIYEGDTIQVTGSSPTVVVASINKTNVATDISLSEQACSNAQTALGDIVRIRKISPKEASSIVLVSENECPPALEEIKKTIVGNPLMGANVIECESSEGVVPLRVYKTVPAGPVTISPLTDVTVLDSLPFAEKQVDFSYVGGLSREIEKMKELVVLPLTNPEIFERMGISPPKGLLLYGIPGTGKTLLAKALSNEIDAYFTAINGPEILSKYYGQSEENLRRIFTEAVQNAPAIIFIDEIDAIAPKREEVVGEVERRVVSQLLALMDGLNPSDGIMVIGATNIPNAIDPALRRPGRFDREMEIGVPDRKAREEILYIHSRDMPLSPDVDLKELARITHGYVGADLESLCKEAAMRALKHGSSQKKGELTEVTVDMRDFLDALQEVEPSGMREALVHLPSVTWEDIGGLHQIKARLREMIEWPLTFQESYQRMDITAPKGIIITGPSGCGKTLLANAVATESEVNFINIRCPELLSKWVGESEERIAKIFKRARQVAPCILFLEGIETIAQKSTGGTDSFIRRMTEQLLLEMDGIEHLENVMIIGETNTLDMLDPSLLRAGRFEVVIEVSLPDEAERCEILTVCTRKKPLKGVDLSEIARKTEGMSGSDLFALCREAAMVALREDTYAQYIEMRHFLEAVSIMGD
jgi:transitional endoplasmic reticulum ATPase